MTALDRTFIKAFRRRESDADRPQPSAAGNGDAEETAALKPAESEAPDTIAVFPNWQWPSICEELSRGAAEGFANLAAEIEDRRSRADRPVVALSASQAGVGCTSVFLTLARTLAARAAHPLLLIDANSTGRTLHKRMRITGIDELPSMSDLTPFRMIAQGLGVASLPKQVDEIRTAIAQLAKEFPLILIDAGSVAAPVNAAAVWEAGVIDTAILVDFDDHDIEQRNSAVEFLSEHAGEFLGVIETRRADLCTDVGWPRLTG